MKINLLVILVSITALYFGIKVIVEPEWMSTKYMHKIDVSGYNIPFGILFIIFAVILLYSEYIRIKK